MDEYAAELLCSALRCGDINVVPKALQDTFVKFKTIADRLGGGELHPQCIALVVMLSGVPINLPDPEAKKPHGTVVRAGKEASV